MKKIYLSLMLTLSIMFCNANVVTQTLDTIGNRVTAVVDSSIAAVKEGVAFVDTSSNFKAMYNDVKEGIVAIAAALKVTAEHVYRVLVMQQVVHAITWLLIVCVLCFVPLIYWKKITAWAKDEGVSENGEGLQWIVWALATVAPILIGVITFCCTATTIVAGFVNPEYGAIMDILQFVNSIK